MTREERLKMLMKTREFDFLKDIPPDKIWKLVFMLEFMGDTESEDCISREEVNKLIQLMFYELGDSIYAGKIQAEVNKLPSIHPKTDVLDKIRAEINKPVIRDEYSQRQNDYCDGYEFVCNRIKEIISEDKEC